MTVESGVQLILAAATLVSAVGGLILALQNHARLAAVHDLVNSQAANLVSLEKTASFQAGQAAGPSGVALSVVKP